MIGLDFVFGMAATLSAEFLLAHAWMWYSGGGANTVSGLISTVENDLSKIKATSSAFERRASLDVKSIPKTVETSVENAIQRVIHPSAPVMTQPTSGGTPVPTVVMSAPGT